MIKSRNLIILGVVLVLLIGSVFAVMFFLSGEEEQDSDLTDLSSDVVEVYQIDETLVTEIEAEVNGETFAFTRDNAESDWIPKDLPDVKANQSNVDVLCSNLATMTAEQVIAESAEDLSIYGLDDPQGIYTVRASDGTVKTSMIGNEDPVSGSYYFKTEDSPVIYTLYSTRASSMLQEFASYRDDSLMTIDTANLSYFKIEKPDGSVIEVDWRTVGEGEEATSDWWMLQPREKKCDSQRVSENVSEKITSWTPEEYIYNGTDRDAQYGLGAAATLITLRDLNGTEQKFEIGKKEGDIRYIRPGGTNIVYSIQATSVSMADLDPFLLLEKFINLENIDNVNSIDVSAADGRAHTLTIVREGDNTAYQIDGNTAQEDDFKAKYQSVIGLTADGFSENPQKSAPLYTVTYHLTDGSTKTYEFCAYDDRNYAVFGSDGSQEYYIRQKKLEEMMTAIEQVAEAEE